MVPVLVLTFVLQAAVHSQPAGVGQLTLSAPTRLARIDAGTIQGEPNRLAWSPDSAELYLRTAQFDRWANERNWHYRVVVATGKLEAIPREVEWFPRYWAWKAGFFAPGVPDFRIDIESREQMVTATRPDNAGALGTGGSDPSGPGSELGPQGRVVTAYLMQGQKVTVTTLRLRGEVLAEFVNRFAVAGLTYSWSPQALGVIAFANSKGRLAVMDRLGRKHVLAGTSDVRLPAWSGDGKQLAWLEKKGKTYAVMVAGVGIR